MRCGRLCQQQVRSVPPSLADSVLQKPVREVDGWPQELGRSAYLLADREASVHDHLEIEARDSETGHALVVGCGGGQYVAAGGEGAIEAREMVDDIHASTVLITRRRRSENGVALELHQL